MLSSLKYLFPTRFSIRLLELNVTDFYMEILNERSFIYL